MKPSMPMLAALLVVLSACDAPPVPQDAAVTRGAVVYSVKQLAGSSDRPQYNDSRACRVAFSVTYPADVTPHQRQIDIRMLDSAALGSFDSSGPLTLPFPSDRPDLQRNSDGTITWQGRGTSFSPCRSTSWQFVIGPCLSGDCPRATFVRSDQMGDISVDVRTRE